jgi:hypothetical protein
MLEHLFAHVCQIDAVRETSLQPGTSDFNVLHGFLSNHKARLLAKILK